MEELIREWGYIVLFLYSFGGGFIALAAAGVLSYTGDLNIVISILVAGTSNFIGDQFLFLMARHNKQYAKDMMKKYGRKVALAHLMMRRYGSYVIVVQKYIYGIKTLIPLAMGLTKYNSKRFMMYNALATVLWAVIVGSVSYLMGEIVLTYMEEYKYVGVAFILSIVLGVAYYLKKI